MWGKTSRACDDRNPGGVLRPSRGAPGHPRVGRLPWQRVLLALALMVLGGALLWTGHVPLWGSLLVGLASTARGEALDRSASGKREQVFSLILQKPGIQLQQVVELTGLPRSTVRYHVRMLNRRGEVITLQQGKGVFIYPTEFVTTTKRLFQLNALPDPLDQAILGFLQMSPGATQKEIAGALGIHPSKMCRRAAVLVEKRVLTVNRSARDDRLRYYPAREGSPFDVLALQALTGGGGETRDR